MKGQTICGCVLAAAVLVGTIAIACAPSFPRAVFTYAHHPDFPRTAYLNGKLGVFEPSYARSYLAIAYRYMNGPALNAMERQQIRDYWKDRETGDWDKTATDWVAKWEAARTRVPGAAPRRKNEATHGLYSFNAGSNSFFLNCAEDAYRTAYETIEARGARFGFRSAAVRSWRDAQDAVFANCDGGPSIPPPADAALPPLIRADREYQVAAANFYAGNSAQAESRFRRIAETPSSPWSGIAPYLVVRTLTRAAGDDPARLSVAESAARAVIGNRTLVPLHGMTRVLLHRMILEDKDENYFHELARDLAGGREGRSFREELWDYTILFDRYAGYDPWERGQKDKKKIDSAIFSRDEMSDWIFTFQAQESKTATHALARWRQRGSLPWLIAALRYATPQSPDSAGLIAAAGKVDASSPAYEIASFYRLSLMVDSGEKAEARNELDRLLQAPLSKSAVNLFRGLRMRTAPNLTDFLTFAARTPVMLTTDWNVGEVPGWDETLAGRPSGNLLLDRDSIKILNERSPLRLLREDRTKRPCATICRARFRVVSVHPRAASG